LNEKKKKTGMFYQGTQGQTQGRRKDTNAMADKNVNTEAWPKRHAKKKNPVRQIKGQRSERFGKKVPVPPGEKKKKKKKKKLGRGEKKSGNGVPPSKRETKPPGSKKGSAPTERPPAPGVQN